MRSTVFVVGAGRSGSTALSRIVNEHPDVLSLNELLTSVGENGIPESRLSGRRFWRLLADPHPLFETMIRSGVPLPEFLHTRGTGRFSAQTTGIPALALMVLPHLTDDPDSLFDALEADISRWPERTAPDHYQALFDALCERFGRSAVVERSGLSLPWVPRLRTAFPQAKFVHLFRDGPDCALSMSRHVGFRTTLLLREILSLTGTHTLSELTESDIQSLPPDLAALLGDRFDPALIHHRTLPLSAFAAMWSQLVIQGTAHLRTFPAHQRTTLAYEDLIDAPRRELARLAHFIGVAPLTTWLDTGCSLLDTGRRGASLRLPVDDLATLKKWCAPGTLALASR
ncbi:sulfotransferase family protein [Streptomyces sp. NPDC051567]|uniref:sulfotransferase family protein n=1 Tax=Streptomyces sp. NPDC051567 TaxID=3365660 RepID=UPI00379A79C2